MTKMRTILRTLFPCALSAAWLALAPSANAGLLVSFPFDEGSGTNVTDAAQGLKGRFGYNQDPAIDYVAIMPASPSGLPGDNCITNGGNGFLLVSDSPSPILNITNGPITIECWIYIDASLLPKPIEGLIGYGSSYRMGMKNGRQVFGLLGLTEITNTSAGVPAGSWVHIAAAWEPGVGVHFYMDGVEDFEANTATVALPPSHNYLSIGAESFFNNTLCALDRVRIHHALLSAGDLDSDRLNPKAPLPSTLVAYNFNESSFPCNSSVTPARPTALSSEVTCKYGWPSWSSDSPSGLPNDYSLNFQNSGGPLRERVEVNYLGELIPLGVNNTNYTLEAWVKLQPSEGIEERRVIFRGPTNAPRVSMSVHAPRTMHTTLFGNKDFDSPVAIPNDGRWHHMACVMENFSVMRFYLDGILRNSTNRVATGALNSGAAMPNLLIGLENEGRYFRGQLDRLRIHNSALTPAQFDFPAIPDAPRITAQPADTTADTGATATFTAAVTSGSDVTYQWYYRTNRPDIQIRTVPGATSATLTLSGVKAADQGFYFLKAGNASGSSETYGARLLVRTTPYLSFGGFESPRYQAGALEDQDYWSNDQNGNVVRVRTASDIAAALSAAGLTVGEPVHGGNQALLVSGVGLGTTSIRQVPGFESQQKITIDAWLRPLIGGNLGNVFFTAENASGTRAAAVRFGLTAGVYSIDWGSSESGIWVASGQLWDPAGSTWYRVTMVLDYATKYYDFYLNGAKINANPIRFYNTNSDKLSQIRIFRGTSQSGMIVDDLTIAGPLKLTDLSASGENVVINWMGGAPPYQLQSCTSLETPNWANVGGATTANQATQPLGTGNIFYRVIGN